MLMPQTPRPERLSPVRASVGDVQRSLRRVTARQPLDDHLLFNRRKLPIALRRQALIDATIASTFAGSRPSEKFGTHSMSRFIAMDSSRRLAFLHDRRFLSGQPPQGFRVR